MGKKSLHIKISFLIIKALTTDWKEKKMKAGGTSILFLFKWVLNKVYDTLMLRCYASLIFP